MCARAALGGALDDAISDLDLRTIEQVLEAVIRYGKEARSRFLVPLKKSLDVER